jgi:hypothetical protein
MSDKRRTRIATVALLGTVEIIVLLTIYAYRMRSRPVLMHLLAETDCACGDFHEEVSGLVIRNPFRDRAPEKAANLFFEKLRQGQCAGYPADPAMGIQLCKYALEEHSVANWRLVNRQDQEQHVLLYYKLTKLGVENLPHHNLTGEGEVAVTETGGKWFVTGYSSYF